MKTFAEQVAALKATRQEKDTAMRAVAQKSVDEARSMDTAESEQFDTFVGEIKRLDSDISRLTVLADMDKATAKAVTNEGADLPATGGMTRLAVQVKNTQKLEPGIAFARAAKCLALGHLEHRDATQIAKSLYEGQDDIIKATMQLVTKAPVAAATTTNATWAGNLIQTGGPAADFIEWLRPSLVIGAFGSNGVPSLRRVPFRVPLIGQTSGGDAFWTAEGNAKPVTKFDFSRTMLEPLKIANIAVATMETVRDSSPSADAIIRDQLAAALRQKLDVDFLDPSKAAAAGVSPASITNGATAIASSGNDAEAVRADVKALFSTFIAANNAPTSGVFIMSATTALALSLMQNPLGQTEFPGLSMTGGRLFGLPTIISENIPTDSSGSIVILANASDIYLGDEGGIDVSMSTEASLQMDSAPDNPSTASTVMVSLWQRNMIGFRAEYTVSWARRRASAVAYLTGVSWGA